METPQAAAPAETPVEATTEAPKGETPKADATKPATPVDENGVALPQPKKIWKLNVNGKEVEYDASDEKRLQRDIQKVFGIEEKAKTAAQKAEEADALFSMLQSDPNGFAKRCKAAGINAEKLATDILYDVIRRNSMTPEQRELEEYKEREAEAAAKKKADDEAAKNAEVQRKTQEFAQKFENDLTEALKAGKIPKSRLALALAAQYVDAGLAQKKEWSVAQVIPWVVRDLKEIHSSTMGKLDGDELLDYIGEELSNKIAKARVDRYKKTQSAPVQQPKPTDSPKRTSREAELQHILKTKGRSAYFAAMRRLKSDEGIGMYPGQQ